jgi:hypothetical protein
MRERLCDNVQPHKVIGVRMRNHYGCERFLGLCDPFSDVRSVAAQHKYVEQNRFGLTADNVRV